MNFPSSEARLTSFGVIASVQLFRGAPSAIVWVWVHQKMVLEAPECVPVGPLNVPSPPGVGGRQYRCRPMLMKFGNMFNTQRTFCSLDFRIDQANGDPGPFSRGIPIQ